MKRLILVASLAATPALAQTPPAPSAVRTAGTLWEQVTGYITRAAEQMSEADYAFKPTPEVRSFGQLVGHVAGAQYMICAAALGDPPRGEDDIEQTKKTKADLVAALRASNDYCRRAYAQTDAAAMQKATVFGQQSTRLYALLVNATHDNEHYGNIVTYMRMKGKVPPSSQR